MKLSDYDDKRVFGQSAGILKNLPLFVSLLALVLFLFF